ncbi:MAG: glycosyltransferase [Actinomycetota bacterium]|nr:glycosyltransferase [Actinomycetota bacterium]
MKRPTISLCMIVKDEEENLDRCLASVKEAVDEIVIVDTGSSDRTVEIAKGYGAKVFHHDWTGDFSAARNVSLEMATSDWILWLDADEEIILGDEQMISSTVSKAGFEAFFVTEYNFMEGGDSEADVLVSMPVRIFRNRKEYRFKRAIHEQIAGSIKDRGGRFGHSSARINHYGYSKQAVYGKEKIRRNIDIILADLKKSPKDSFIHFNLGTEYLRERSYEKAILSFQNAYKYLDDYKAEFVSLIPRNLLICLKAIGRFDDALEVIEDSLKIFPDFTDLEFIRGLIYKEQKKYDSAITSFERCLAMGEAPLRYVSQRGSGSYQAHDGLGMVYGEMGYVHEAISSFANALRDNPKDVFAARSMCKILLSHEDADSVIAFIDRTLDLSFENNLLAMASLFCEEGMVGQALGFAERAAELFPASFKSELVRGECLMNKGDFEGAISIFAKVPESYSEYYSAKIRLVVASALSSDFNLAKAVLRDLREAKIEILDIAAAVVEVLMGSKEAPAVSSGNRAAKVAFLEEVLRLNLRLDLFESFEKLLGLYDLLHLSRGEKSLRLGKLLYDNGFADLGCQELMIAVESDQADVESLNMLAKTCEKNGLMEDAVVFYKHSLSKEPGQLRPYTAIAKIYSSLGMTQEAVKILEMGAEKLPESKVLRETVRAIKAISA